MQRTVIPNNKGIFVIDELPAGAYLLEIASTKYSYPTIRVDVSAKYNGKVKAKYATESIPLDREGLKYPLDIYPLHIANYIEEKEPFNIMELLKSPMVIMIGISALMIFILPKLMEQMDPEKLKQMQDEIKSENK